MELWLTAILFFGGILLGAWERAAPIFRAGRRAARRICATPARATGTVVLSSFALYAAPSLYHVPAPTVHDEFAYLLAGDTFARGRLTNPPHAMAKFFETFHVLQTPTYASKFPVGPGMALCVGFWLGAPIAGVWLGLAAAMGAVLWMLRAAMPLRWATVSTLLLAIQPTVLFFSQNYWGGGVAILGGALLGGATLRLIGSPPLERPVRLGLIAGAGMGILANTRPFEGMLVAAACGLAVTIAAARSKRIRPIFMRVAPAAMGVLLVVLGWMAYYNLRVTGNPAVMPYALHTARYMASPLFYWQGVPPTPAYPNAQMLQFHTRDELPEYLEQLGGTNYLRSVGDRLGLLVWSYVRPLVTLIPIVAAACVCRRLKYRTIILYSMGVCVALPVVHVAVCPWMRVAYMAPLAGVLAVVIGTGLRGLNAWRWRGTQLGRAVVRGIVLTQIGLAAYCLPYYVTRNARGAFADRVRIIDRLTRDGGKHLIVVHYAERGNAFWEWVFNGADVDGSPVVFARSLGRAADEELLRYYVGRKVWRLDVSDTARTLSE